MVALSISTYTDSNVSSGVIKDIHNFVHILFSLFLTNYKSFFFFLHCCLPPFSLCIFLLASCTCVDVHYDKKTHFMEFAKDMSSNGDKLKSINKYIFDI